jgi:hypothetical protein
VQQRIDLTKWSQKDNVKKAGKLAQRDGLEKDSRKGDLGFLDVEGTMML